MEKEEIIVLAQLLNSMKESLQKLKEYTEKGDYEKVINIKREILNFQKEVSKILKDDR